MPKFAVRLKGTGCLVKYQDRIRRIRPLGFYTTRFVEAPVAEVAAARAVTLVREELQPLLANAEGHPCEISIDEVWEDPEAFAQHAPGGGFSWYTEHPQS